MYLERDNQQVETVNKKNLELEVKLKELKAELEGKKQATAAQELTFRVIQERLGKNIYFYTIDISENRVLVYTTNEAEKFKQLAQKRIKQLSSFCSSFLRESSEDFEMENDFEKSLDVLKAEETVKDLKTQLEDLQSENSALSAQLENMVILAELF